MSVYQIVNTWLNRRADYRRLASNRVLRIGITVVITVLFGITTLKPIGLVLGFFVGQVLATIFLSWPLIKFYLGNRGELTLARSMALLKRYKDFPKYSIAAALANGFTAEMPVLILTPFFGPTVVGHYSLASRVVGAPSALISTSFGDVFQERASKEIHTIGNCHETWLKTAKYLLYVASPIFLLVFLSAPFLFPFLFGADWADSGKYAQILIPYVFIGFLASPLSRTLYLMERQKVDLAWQIALMVLSSVAVLIGGWIGQPEVSLGLYSFVYGGMYLLYISLSHKASKTGAVQA